MAGNGKSLGRRIARWAFKSVLWLLAITVFLVLPLRWFPPVTTSFMVQNFLTQDGKNATVRYEWVSRERISRHAALAVMAAEDQKFFDHPGFDRQAIEKAMVNNKKGRRVRGASTISQQLVKNLWLWPGRSWVRKGLEAYLTLWVEWLLPKERILEVYLNVAQFGPNVFGVEAAAQRYFGHPASRLNRQEAARMAAVLPNPVRFSVAKPSAWVVRRQAWIERQARRLAPALPAQRWSKAS
jgi:monofunctional glycosyltransferase